MGASDDGERQATLHAFGHQLKRLRIAGDSTQEELAERAGVSARFISDLERGTSIARAATRSSSWPTACACGAPSATASSPWRGADQSPRRRAAPASSPRARSPTRRPRSSVASRRRRRHSRSPRPGGAVADPDRSRRRRQDATGARGRPSGQRGVAGWGRLRRSGAGARPGARPVGDRPGARVQRPTPRCRCGRRCIDVLQRKRLLLILDNFEHVAAAALGGR